MNIIMNDKNEFIEVQELENSHLFKDEFNKLISLGEIG